ncbi:winged helix-turn-helix transcriptional regulator [Leptolyngbya sp. FACHB-541]|uniref:ArsR/SmtB family transcription factor n=1 Tax=Leptolyngbya sp. FACHB-541 TaxID=2692810 RepID=UPI001688B7C4|nr:metalloregulator ArsR/SmtB family transcription factor [Leptolyngbya sp. FACHB-541]MBD1996997.1 winged helix-turn-helix transcriptional regulator [Leptolyngbya sp. FACHB-541]
MNSDFNNKAAEASPTPDKQYSPSFCAQQLKILADPNRFAILKILLDGPKHVWELNAELALEQSLLSHHLKILRQHELVKSQREGKAVLYSLAPGVRVPSGQGLNLKCCILSFECPIS